MEEPDWDKVPPHQVEKIKMGQLWHVLGLLREIRNLLTVIAGMGIFGVLMFLWSGHGR